MGPDTQDTPARLPQQAVRATVAGSIAHYLGAPVVLVAMGQVAMPWTAMPKATVNKDSDPLTMKDEVGVSWDSLVASPALDAMGAEDNCHLDLCVFISAGANSSHDLGALLSTKHVGHGQKYTEFLVPRPKQVRMLGGFEFQNGT